MKKTFALLLAFVLVLALFAGCGGKDEPAAESPADTGSGAAEPAAPAPAPEAAAGMQTVTVGNDQYGTISFSFPENDNSIEVTVLDNDIEESLDVLLQYDEKLVLSNSIPYVRAHIKGDGFNMVFGINDYSSSPMKTYKATKWFREDLHIDDVSYGGMTGYSYLCDIYQLIFPSATQFAVRTVGIYPEEKPESSSYMNKEEWEYLLDIPKVKEILDTVTFSTAVNDEPPWETTTLDSTSYTVTPTDGWEIYSSWVDSIDLKKDGVNDMKSLTGDAATISISGWGMFTAQRWMDEKIIGSSFDRGQKQVDNIKINGREFLAAEYDNPLSDTFVFITTRGDGFDPESEKIVLITISYLTDYSKAMAQLENIEISD